MKALIVRPHKAAGELKQALHSVGVASVSCPLVSFQPAQPDPAAVQHLLSSHIIVCVSQPAADFTHQWLTKSGLSWPADADYFAVGEATALLLQQLSGHSVRYATPSTTEGLISLISQQPLSGKVVTILRGSSGRELLIDQLRDAGAKVEYAEVYIRQWQAFDSEVITKWQRLAVDTLIVTSFEQLEFFEQLIPTEHKNWLQSLRLIVPSQRIAALAKNMGFQFILDSSGASNSAIVDKIQGELNRKIK